MRIENLEVHNLTNAIRGMRNRKRDWYKSFSIRGIVDFDKAEKLACDNNLAITDVIIWQESTKNCEVYIMDPDDQQLAQELLEQHNYTHLKQIQVSMDLTAPLYWWLDFLTRKSELIVVNFEGSVPAYLQSPSGASGRALIGGPTEEIPKQIPLGFETMATITMTYDDCRMFYEKYFELIEHSPEWKWFIKRLMGLPYAKCLFL